MMGKRQGDLRWLQCWRAMGDRISVEGSAQGKLLHGGPYGRSLKAREAPGMSPWRATGDRISMEGSAQEKLLFGGPYGRPPEAREVPGMSP